MNNRFVHQVNDLIQLQELLESEPERKLSIPFSPYSAYGEVLQMRRARGQERSTEGWDIVLTIGGAVFPIAREKIALWLAIAQLVVLDRSDK